MVKIMQLPSLYEQDILLWVEDTVTKLRNRDFEHLDLDNLIEEVESLGISQRKELLNRLTRLLEHLLKRLYVASSEDYNGWERTIREQRRQLQFALEEAPSLKNIWETSFDRAWIAALKEVLEDYPQVDFPSEWPYSKQVEAMLNKKFWEKNS
jgi:hypothetical protein